MSDPERCARINNSLPLPTDRVSIGSLQVSPVCIGSVSTADVIPAACAMGCNFFFVTCDMHWPYYEQTRRGIAEAIHRFGRSRIVVAATLYVTQPEFQKVPIEELIQSVPGLEYVDLVVAGGAYAGDLLPRLDVLRQHATAGRFGIRAVAASFHQRSAARVAVEARLVDVAFVRFNSAHPGARTEVFPSAATDRPPVYCFTSTAGFVTPDHLSRLGVSADAWRPVVTDHYRYVLSHCAVRGILCALANVGQLDELQRALEQPPLTAEECEYLENASLLAAGAAELHR